MNFSVPRFLRFVGGFLLLTSLTGSLIFARNQTRFQRFLSNHYITFDDFPPAYADTLRSKDSKSLEQGSFDYARYFPLNDDTTSELQAIPRKIHFIWFKDLYASETRASKIPAVGSHAPGTCQKHNPEYDVQIWNATAGRGLIEKHYSWFLPTYDTYKFPIQRIDALKYFILWHYGGVYMDMDIACRRPLDPLMDYPAWFPAASPLGVNNDLMATRPRHPTVAIMLENLEKRNRNLFFPYLTIFWSTGPQFTSDMLKKWFLERRSQDVEAADNWFVLPNQFYSEEYTFFGHSPGGTWHGEDVAVVLWLAYHPVITGILTMGLLSGCLAPILWRRRKSREREVETGDGDFESQPFASSRDTTTMSKLSAYS